MHGKVGCRKTILQCETHYSFQDNLGIGVPRWVDYSGAVHQKDKFHQRDVLPDFSLTEYRRYLADFLGSQCVDNGALIPMFR